MSSAVVFAIVLVSGLGVAAVLGRALFVRLVQTRQDRLKAHLDWVNRTPQTSRKRRLLRG